MPAKKKTEGAVTTEDRTRTIRADAEEQLVRSPKSSPELEGQTPDELIHELQVYQIELETQAEELRRTRLEAEESRDKFLDQYDFAPVALLTLSDKGIISDLNLTASTLLGVPRSNLLTVRFGKFFAEKEANHWHRYFVDLFRKDNKQSVTLEVTRGDGSTFPAHLEGVRFTSISGVTTARVAISDISDIRRIEAAQRESEEKFRGIFDNINDGVHIHETGPGGKPGKFIEVNKVACLMLQYTREELLEHGPLDFVTGYHNRPFSKIIGELNSTGHAIFETEHRRKDGTVLPVEVNAHVIGFMGKRVVVSVVRDITGRRHAEESLRESEERFRMLFEQGSDPIFIADPKTLMITDCNQKAEVLSGYTREELLSLRVDALHPEDVRVATMENFMKLRDGMNDSVDSVIITRDGRRVPVSISGGSIEVNGQFTLIGSFRDMTRQKKAENALAESENKYRHLFEHAGEAIVVAQDNKLRLVNPRLIELTGYSEEELLTIPFLSYIHPSHHDNMMRIYSRLLKGEHEEYFPHYSIQLITREGGIKWVDLGAVAIDWEGRPATLNFLTDITERKKAEDALITAYNDLERQVIDRTADLFSANLQLKTEIEHRKLIAESLKESAKITTILNEVIITANQADTLPQLFRDTLDRALELLDFDGGGIYLVDKAEKTATIHYYKNLPGDFIEKRRTVSIDVPPYDTLFVKNQPIITKHFEEISPELAKTYHFLSLASIPLVSKNKVIGAFNVASTKRYTISADEIQVLTAIGRELGTTVERMIAEEEVKNVSVNLQTLFDSINEMVFVLDMKGHILKVNDTVVKRLQYTPGELTGMDVLELHVPERRNEALCNVQGMIAGTADSCPVPLQTKKQEVIEVETKVTRGWWNDQEVLIGVSRDVTEHNRAEKEIEWQATLIRSLLDSIPDIIFFKDKKGVYLGCNPPFAEFVGRSREEIIGMTDYELFDKEIADFFRENDERMLELGEPRHNEEWITYPGGRKILIDTLKTPYWGPDGTLIGVLGISRDITERKVSEENLLQLSDRLSLAVQAGGVGIWDFDVVTNKLTWDDQMFALYGITREQFSGAYEAWQAGLHPEDRVRGDIEIQKALHGEKEFDTEFRVLWPDGTIRTIRALALVQRDDAGLPLRMIGTNWDITDQKNAEKALQENDILLRLILSLSARFINISSDKIYHEISNALGELGRFAGVDRSYVFLLSPDGMTMSNTHEWCTEGIVPQRDTLQDLPTGMFPWWMEKIHRNETIHVPRVADLPPEASNEKDILLEQGIQSVLIVPLISQNTLIGFLGFDSVRHEKIWPENIITLVTITGKSISNAIERERAEEALRKSEEQLSLALEGSGVGLWDWRVQTGETIFNERWAGILGYTLAELSPVSIKTWESLSHPDDLARSGELLQSHFSGKTPTYECEARMKHKDGHWVWVLDRGKVVEWDEASLPIRMTGTHLDITERVRHEEEIAASLMEKETLLKEIHHRVKNNMQVISSLLNLQAKKIKDKETLEIFRESQNRVRSIALVHEKLYRSKSLSQIDFKEFLQKLGENLFLSYDARKDQVTLQISADEIYLPIDKAIPLGLITNELLTNSLKYAFPDRRKGTISIELRKDKENYLYIFRDDGSGFPNDVEFVQGSDGNDQAKTLGLQLVIALVGQIQGTVNLDRVNGSAFEIRFSYEPKGEEQN